MRVDGGCDGWWGIVRGPLGEKSKRPPFGADPFARRMRKRVAPRPGLDSRPCWRQGSANFGPVVAVLFCLKSLKNAIEPGCQPGQLCVFAGGCQGILAQGRLGTCPESYDAVGYIVLYVERIVPPASTERVAIVDWVRTSGDGPASTQPNRKRTLIPDLVPAAKAPGDSHGTPRSLATPGVPRWNFGLLATFRRNYIGACAELQTTTTVTSRRARPSRSGNDQPGCRVVALPTVL